MRLKIHKKWVFNEEEAFGLGFSGYNKMVLLLSECGQYGVGGTERFLGECNIGDFRNFNPVINWSNKWQAVYTLFSKGLLREADETLGGVSSKVIKCICSSTDLWRYGCPIDRGEKCRSGM